MLRFLSLMAALLMSYLPSLVACEGCKEPANVAGDSGVAGISASFSWSVIFMIGMVAFLLTGMVLMMIRSCKQLANQRHPAAVSLPADLRLRRLPVSVPQYPTGVPVIQL
jgi:hypothetical protein